MEDGENQADICRVCRSEGTPDKPLYHPCVCTGSIKFIHQDCLVQWLKYSKKEYCELCKYRFAFTPIYSPDMPKRLPIKDIFSGLLTSIGRAVRYWFHYTLVAFAWLGVVPLTACRIYRCLFTGSVSSLLTLPLDMLSTENIVSDSFQGCFVVTCTLCAFISLVWLREQILHGGGPDWLEHEDEANNQGRNFFEGGVMNNLMGMAPIGRGMVGNANAEGNGAAAGAGEGGNLNEEGLAGAPEVEVFDVIAMGPNNAAQDDNNWNPIEWDRAAEELTWERLLGLDGSLVFLEHVFWVVSLNTLFILVFAFCPYHIGHFTLVGLKIDDFVVASHFEGLLTALTGYIVFALGLVSLYLLCALVRIKRFRRLIGLCYVVVKVKLLVVVEIGVFPLICGWWLDVCSLAMFDATLKERKNSFHLAPGTSMFVHWLVGMVYVFYFASFILLLREVLRPGLLWFLRNLNDPEFNPIQEMIHLPVYRHVRRFIASVVIFGSTVLLMLWLPVRVIRKVMPQFLPYNAVLNSDAAMSELSLELLLLQVVLPALLEQGYIRAWLKGVVRGWTVAMAWLLDLRSYLIGDIALTEQDNIIYGDQPGNGGVGAGVGAAGGGGGGGVAAADGQHNNAAAPAGNEPAAAAAAADAANEPAAQQLPPPPPPPPPPPAPAPAPPQVQAGLGAVHQAMLQGGGPTGFQAYKRSSFFSIRVFLLVVFMCITLFIASLISLVVPVFIGRKIMAIWMGDAKVHELYTAACGLYMCWLLLRIATVLYNWIPQGTAVIMKKLKEWAILALESLTIATFLLGVIPLLLGMLFELVIVVPLKVPIDQTPLYFPWQDWALGVLHAKIVCAITMMGPHWWLKRAIEQVYNDGFRNMNVRFILFKLCAPVIATLGMALAVPYVIGKTIVPALGFNPTVQNIVLRRIYPMLLAMIVMTVASIFQARQFKRLYEHIKNDKYLVGQRLVNYEPKKNFTTTSSGASPSSMTYLPNQQQGQQPLVEGEAAAAQPAMHDLADMPADLAMPGGPLLQIHPEAAGLQQQQQQQRQV
ncbi:E3 ubiquitin-protein ligase MARCH6-like [Octopus vulgaris]|uniref:E3 ubiquitin-protein ligase MARCHF6 n=1 Tax=Octopus vulgaris TaxID=6645 RepID=A0AA36AEU3_OCTVU|nr:E3 ubiquitin-protein ligase MARCH6-like [Octopus vulgaris]